MGLLRGASLAFFYRASAPCLDQQLKDSTSFFFHRVFARLFWTNGGLWVRFLSCFGTFILVGRSVAGEFGCFYRDFVP